MLRLCRWAREQRALFIFYLELAWRRTPATARSGGRRQRQPEAEAEAEAAGGGRRWRWRRRRPEPEAEAEAEAVVEAETVGGGVGGGDGDDAGGRRRWVEATEAGRGGGETGAEDEAGPAAIAPREVARNRRPREREGRQRRNGKGRERRNL